MKLMDIAKYKIEVINCTFKTKNREENIFRNFIQDNNFYLLQ